ncbi:NAD(P)-binding protein [Roseateles toxinivorans]|uniref:Putative NAD/FAD-binding protein n=1 Tax=Roseateles toxinivorans TaxID=270368 RepID=A0A4R6QSZ4_9BURK|nr:NAD(P)-binding protein [Roseateles toxinivorans]TDP74770.1 putative NAD/FAD-binding protein [Roseateles toxinivorans]
MEIAVIGGGIAGLVAAWQLSRRHAVTLFERHAVPGFVASSVALDATSSGLRIDVPLRVFYPGYYPTLTRLYAELGVATEPVDYATTFSDCDGLAYFRWRNARLGGWSLPYVLPQDVASARGWRIVQGALRFQTRARAALAAGGLGGASIGEFVAAERISPEFVDGLLLPAIATIATCSTEDARAYPAAVVAGYAAAGVARQSVRRARDGADAVAAKLLAGITRVQCKAGVVAVRRQPGAASSTRHAGAGRVTVQHVTGEEAFDHVVFATQANQALTLLADAAPDETAAMAAFRYRALEVLMHRDTGLMPRRRADWSPVNARVCAEHEQPESTIWINRVHPGLRHAEPLFQTVMPQRSPRDGSVIGQARFERPLVDAGSAAALASLQQLHAQPQRRVWWCGSYAETGVPLLESAVRSALAVAARVEAEASPAPARFRQRSPPSRH